MATSTLVPIEQYLHTSYKPECEWVDGVLKEKSMPNGYHGYFQKFLMQLIDWNSGGLLRALSEVRFRVSARSHRVPDVMAIPSGIAFLPSPKVMPSICLEVLSPDDRESDLLEEIDDFVSAGIEAIWIVDPRNRTFSTADAAGIHPVSAFSFPSHNLTITLDELFGDLDKLEAL